MASSTSASTLIVLIACFCLANVHAARNVNTVRRSALAGQGIPSGWWYAIKPKFGNGTFCGLRDFPPRPDGYGAARMYCVFPTYDHYWMWRIIQVKTSSNSIISSGNEVFLTIFNPMPYNYCQLKSNVMCGYQTGTKFVIEKATGSGTINTSRDDVVFKVGTQYCNLNGRGHSQQLTCTAALKSNATVFTISTNSFVHSQLVNRLTNRTCGGYFYQGSRLANNLVNCRQPTFPGFTTNLTLALQTPGAPFIAAGAPVAFKAYDDRYTYHVATWVQKGENITYAPEVTRSNSQWFALERASGSGAGGELRNNTLVALRSNATGLYCGQRVANATVLTCDNAGPIRSLPDGYMYLYSVLL